MSPPPSEEKGGCVHPSRPVLASEAKATPGSAPEESAVSLPGVGTSCLLRSRHCHPQLLPSQTWAWGEPGHCPRRRGAPTGGRSPPATKKVQLLGKTQLLAGRGRLPRARERLPGVCHLAQPGPPHPRVTLRTLWLRRPSQVAGKSC